MLDRLKAAAWKVLLVVLFGVGCFAYGAWYAGSAEKAKCEAAKVPALENAIEAHDATATEDQPKLISGVQAEHRERAHTQKLVTEEAANASRSTSVCVLDDNGMRRWRSANEGADVPSPGPSGDSAGGHATAAGGEQRPGADDESLRGGRGVPRAEGPLQPAAGMAEQ